jgi:hypothetical protein
VTHVMQTEFDTFTKALPHVCVDAVDGMATLTAESGQGTAVFPHPTETGGLPKGWVVRGRSEGSLLSSSQKPPLGQMVETFLVERAGGTGGGWGLVSHGLHPFFRHQDIPLTDSILWVHNADTLIGLYEWAQRTVALDPALDAPERHIRESFLAHYDLNDPIEAAEATLLGLGARLTVLPKALT